MPCILRAAAVRRLNITHVRGSGATECDFGVVETRADAARTWKAEKRKARGEKKANAGEQGCKKTQVEHDRPWPGGDSTQAALPQGKVSKDDQRAWNMLAAADLPKKARFSFVANVDEESAAKNHESGPNISDRRLERARRRRRLCLFFRGSRIESGARHASTKPPAGEIHMENPLACLESQSRAARLPNRIVGAERARSARPNFTSRPKEATSLDIRRGASAPRAAGVIHVTSRRASFGPKSHRIPGFIAHGARRRQRKPARCASRRQGIRGPGRGDVLHLSVSSV